MSKTTENADYEMKMTMFPGDGKVFGRKCTFLDFRQSFELFHWARSRLPMKPPNVALKFQENHGTREKTSH